MLNGLDYVKGLTVKLVFITLIIELILKQVI